MKHELRLSDGECRVLIQSLYLFIQNPEMSSCDKLIADRLRLEIFDKVKHDKQKAMGLYDKCGECRWLDMDDKSCVGYACKNPEKKWRSATAHRHQKSCKACKKFEWKKR